PCPPSGRNARARGETGRAPAGQAWQETRHDRTVSLHRGPPSCTAQTRSAQALDSKASELQSYRALLWYRGFNMGSRLPGKTKYLFTQLLGNPNSRVLPRGQAGVLERS